MPSGSGGKKKKWHLAEPMNFLLPFMAPHKRSTSNMPVKRKKEEIENERTENAQTENEVVREDNDEGEVGRGDESIVGNNSEPPSTVNVGEIDEMNPRKKKSKTAAEVVDEPMAAYFKSITNKNQPDDHPVLMFFKGLMPDIEKLSTSLQRRFKTDVLATLNFYSDLQENSEIPQSASAPNYSGQTNSNSASSSNFAPPNFRYAPPPNISATPNFRFTPPPNISAPPNFRFTPPPNSSAPPNVRFAPPNVGCVPPSNSAPSSASSGADRRRSHDLNLEDLPGLLEL